MAVTSLEIAGPSPWFRRYSPDVGLPASSTPHEGDRPGGQGGQLPGTTRRATDSRRLMWARVVIHRPRQWREVLPPHRPPGRHCSPGTGSGPAGHRARWSADKTPPAKALVRAARRRSPLQPRSQPHLPPPPHTALLRPCTTRSTFVPPRPSPQRARKRVPAFWVDRLTSHRPPTRATHPRPIPTTTTAASAGATGRTPPRADAAPAHSHRSPPPARPSPRPHNSSRICRELP